VGHWTREYILYLQIKPTGKWWGEFVKTKPTANCQRGLELIFPFTRLVWQTPRHKRFRQLTLMTTRLLTLLIFGLLTCCNSSDDSSLIDKYPDLKAKIGRVQKTPKGNYYKLLISSDSTCKIEWGNEKINKKSTLDYPFRLATRILFESEDGWLVLKSDTTIRDDCFQIICPLDKKGDELTLVIKCK
jgi:hypothetical protein